MWRAKYLTWGIRAHDPTVMLSHCASCPKSHAALECPHCHRTAFPAWRKIVLAHSATCRKCGGKVSAPREHFLTTLLLVPPVVVALEPSVNLYLAAVLLIDAVALGFWMHYNRPLIAQA
jgi:hypothetical protein